MVRIIELIDDFKMNQEIVGRKPLNPTLKNGLECTSYIFLIF